MRGQFSYCYISFFFWFALCHLVSFPPPPPENQRTIPLGNEQNNKRVERDGREGFGKYRSVTLAFFAPSPFLSLSAIV